MKTIFIGLALLVSTFLSAQEIGIRFGEVSGNNIAVDGVFDFNGSRIHANLSFGDGVGLDALWDFVYEPLGDEALNWYAGVGPSTYFGDDFFLGVSGEIGLEYVFNDAPIVIGFDYRPTFWILKNTNFDWGGFGLNIRYIF